MLKEVLLQHHSLVGARTLVHLAQASRVICTIISVVVFDFRDPMGVCIPTVLRWVLHLSKNIRMLYSPLGVLVIYGQVAIVINFVEFQ